MADNYSSFIGLLPFNDNVTIIKQDDKPAINEWGDPIYNSIETPCKANIFYNHKLESIGTANGTTLVYTATIYLKGACAVEANDKVKFTDALGNEVEKTIELVVPVQDFSRRVIAVKVVV